MNKDKIRYVCCACHGLIREAERPPHEAISHGLCKECYREAREVVDLASHDEIDHEWEPGGRTK